MISKTAMEVMEQRAIDERRRRYITGQESGEPPIRPLHDRVAVILDEFKEESKHIITPDVAKEKPYYGTVEATGPGRWREDDSGRYFQPMMVKAGDRVLISPAVNLGYSDIMEQQGRVIIQEADILGVLS